MCFLLHPLTYPDKLETSLREAQQAQLRLVMDLPRAGRGKRKGPVPSQSPSSLQSLGLTSLPTSEVGWQSPHTFMPRSLLYGIFLCFLLTNGNRVEGLGLLRFWKRWVLLRASLHLNWPLYRCLISSCWECWVLSYMLGSQLGAALKDKMTCAHNVL